MRHLAISILLAFTLKLVMAEATAQTIPQDIPPGTYKTEKSETLDACRELCWSDSKCRGVYTLQPDITEESYVCYLNDGLSSGSPFEVLPPEPLDLELAVVELNNYRNQMGLNVVSLDPKLVLSSQVHAEDMATHGMVSHTGTDGSAHTDRMIKNGYLYSIAGENVASGQDSWGKVFQAWKDSPGHNENLLMPEATHFGVALVFEKSTQYRYYWAMIMAAPQTEYWSE